jgi:DNA polymerase-3 subunit delta
MWHLLYGPNDIARDEEVARLKTQVGDPQLASLNTTVMDAGAALKDIQAACDAVSFLAEQRLVIVRNWLSKTGQPKGQAQRKASKDGDDPVSRLIAYLPELPETTALVFVEDGALAETHPLVKFGQDKAHQGRVKFYDLPGNIVQWIVERATQKGKGAEIAPPAAQMLATKINRGASNDRDHFAEDSRLYLRKLDNELEKLVAYAAGRRIESADVELLVADEDTAEMFKFIDAVSLRDGRAAYRLMRGILARGESPLVVMTMLARQTRLMISAREYESLSAERLAQTLGVHSFVAQKAQQQARHFSLPELEHLHHAIFDADVAIKTGRMEDVAALDMLIALFCNSKLNEPIA